MALKISLKANEKFTVNGIVLENGDRKNVLSVISDDAVILRERDIFTEEMAITPAKRIYYVIQLIYMAGGFEAGSQYHKRYWSLINDFVEACNNKHVLEHITVISELIMADETYQAWRASKTLINYENEVMYNVQHTSSRENEETND